MPHSPFQEGFREKYVAVEPGGCWVWMAGTDRYGYGVITRKRAGKNINKRAHRLSWEISKGTIPNGLHVLHRCDNPPCVNPEHLYLGTHLDNMRDRLERGWFKRGYAPRGKSNGNSKLTGEQVKEIRKLSETMTHQSIAEIFHISQSHTTNIINGKSWRIA